MLLVEMIHLLSSTLVESYYWEGVKSDKKTFEQLTTIFFRLREMPGASDEVLIRYRGLPTSHGKLESQYDYVVIFGPLQMDAEIANSMIHRMGIRMSHLSGRISSAFENFHKNGISNLHLRLPDRKPDSLKQLWTCFMIMPQYQKAAKNKKDIKIVKDEKSASYGIVYDENHKPDPNLTMTAALSRMKASSMQVLVGKVADWMRKSSSTAGSGTCTSIYEAIFQNRSLREKLVKPLIEINNLKWLMVAHDQEVVSRHKFEVAGVVSRNFQDSPEVVSKIMDSVYGRD